MEIEKRGTVKLCDVKRGEVFEFNGDIFIRVRDYFDSNSIEIKTGNWFNIAPEEKVILYERAKVVLT